MRWRGRKLGEHIKLWMLSSLKLPLTVMSMIMGCPSKIHLKLLYEEILIRLFVDNTLLYKIFHCHRLSSRSFFVRNRQFHVCARCTGLIAGYIISPLLLPINEYAARFFLIACTALIADGLTQLLKWRESNNRLRVVTGFVTGATSLSFIWVLVTHLFLKLH
jgi:uncharacterized membrane protein